MKSTAEKIKVMQAYEKGEPIEYLSGGKNWYKLLSEPCWDWNNLDYRVKTTYIEYNSFIIYTKVSDAFVAMFALEDDALAFIDNTGLPHEYYIVNADKVELPIKRKFK